ncbi:MAG: hypothetical protein Q8P72_07155, partial [Candidatus Roizmanbacteria bacterium]|nr:hypothetical protein [Candidatus Roizmanbacteria bacterium]
LSHLEEFAGEIKAKVLPGILKRDGSIHIFDTDVSDMARRSVQIKGQDSRERDELIGLETISRSILQGANRAIWLSPPKADYSFAFTFIVDDYDESLEGFPFREYFPRYKEPRDSIEISRDLYTSFATTYSTNNSVSPDSFESARDFLRNPLVFRSESDKDLSDIYRVLEITDQDIEKSEQFRKQLLPMIQPWLNAYVQLVKNMSKLDPNYDGNRMQELDAEGKILFGAMFNTARIVNRQYYEQDDAKEFLHDQAQLSMFDHNLEDERVLFMLAQNMADYQPLTVMGSSCPVAQSSGDVFSSAIANGFSVADAMSIVGAEGIQNCGQSGCTIHTPHFHCPEKEQGGCGGPIDSGKNIEVCPHCKLKKSDLKEQCD